MEQPLMGHTIQVNIEGLVVKPGRVPKYVVRGIFCVFNSVIFGTASEVDGGEYWNEVDGTEFWNEVEG